MDRNLTSLQLRGLFEIYRAPVDFLYQKDIWINGNVLVLGVNKKRIIGCARKIYGRHFIEVSIIIPKSKIKKHLL